MIKARIWYVSGLGCVVFKRPLTAQEARRKLGLSADVEVRPGK